MRTRTTLIRFGLLLALLAGVVAAVIRQRAERISVDDATADLSRAQLEMERGNYPAARRIAASCAARAPGDINAQFIIAECFTKEKDLANALTIYEALLTRDELSTDDRIVALQCGGEILLQQGDVCKAEGYFRDVLDREPLYAAAHNRLAFLLGLEGRRWESMPHLFELIKLDQFSVFQLLLLANPDQNLVVDEFLEQVHRSDPDCLLPQIPLAKQAIEEGNWSRAEELVGQLAAQDADQPEVKMLIGELTYYRNDWPAFLEWTSSLTLSEESHPSAWLIRARWAGRRNDLAGQTRCYVEAYFLNPNSIEACQGLSKLLTTEDEPQERIEYFQRRTRYLQELEDASQLLHRNPDNLREMERAFSSCDWLERYWEAWGWCRAALEVNPNVEWARTNKVEIERVLESDLPQTIVFDNVNDWQYGKYRLPVWSGAGASPGVSEPAPPAARVAMDAYGADIGLAFDYEDGHDGANHDPANGRKIYSTLGGGIAAIDYDLDLYPDLYLAQGAVDHSDPDRQPLYDCFYRNMAGRQWRNVTPSIGVQDATFSQGVAAGDVNNDGFPDIYLGNLGRNRLFMNNGDGTFTDATAAVPDSSSQWTTSVAIVDLNRDGVPDLFDVTYVALGFLEQLCEHDNGYKRTCNPRILGADPDRLLLGDGRGQYVHASTAFADEVNDAMGLGIMVADYFGDGALQVFVANDTDANNFFSIDLTNGVQLQDEALSRGLAFDRRGRAQACMGVAVGDFDRNDELDVFVTNFYGDYNTLYLQHDRGFDDLTHASNLAALSYHLLGFGTQPFDAELDGDLDLFVANGHVDDFEFEGIPYKMPSQILLNDGAGRFTEWQSAIADDYFSMKTLGRAATRLDWNRDGLEDIIVGHLDDPVRLLSNSSTPVGRRLQLSLVGSTGQREPVGAWIEVLDDQERRVARITAGSGYFASNEPVVTLSILHAEHVEARVHWPDRTESVYQNLVAGGHYKLVEGRPRAYLLP